MKLDQNKLKTLKRHTKSYFDGELIVKSGFKPIKIKDGINWDYIHPSNSNTYQTYLHSLNFINVFVELGIYENNDRLLKEARDIIKKWHKSNNNNFSNFAWAEHPAASRIINIMNFQENAKEYKLKNRLFNKIIVDHCEFLNDEKNYKMNNHGLMMDNALLKASTYIKEEKLKKIYEEKALYRIRLALYRDFSRRGVHLENSPEYHRMVIIIYRQIMETLKEKKINIDSNFKNLYKAAIDFKSYLIKPSYEYPMLGDTGQIEEKKVTKRFMDFIDYDSGLAILQNRDKNNLKNSTYLTFKCGYQSKTHKHLDDLSLTYYVDGWDLLIDPGKYSYDGDDPIRKYLISPEAHSTLAVRDKTYKLTNPFNDVKNLKITKFYSTTDYKMISGINKLYDGMTINRSIILTNDPVLIVVDRIVSNNREQVYQNFNLNPEADILKISELLYEVHLGNRIYNVETFDIKNRGINSNIEKGYVSYKFSNYEENRRITFEQNNRSTTFITIINRKDIHVNEVNYQNKKLEFKCKDKSYLLDL
ncbi:heparinase II/III family protein [Salinicoccus sp. HZC-1]|uniref:heparinase II/III domain-containing protein n=1 Tax=Salinicoccus sp. HZC-1 TaxID=3385497 RepID=UPI00398B669F